MLIQGTWSLSSAYKKQLANSEVLMLNTAKRRRWLHMLVISIWLVVQEVLIYTGAWGTKVG